MPSQRLDAEQLDVLRLLGHMYLFQGQAEQSLTLLRALCVLAPDDHRATRALARSAIRCGQAEYALRLLERLADAGEDSPVLHLLRGQALNSLGRGAEAADSLTRFTLARDAAAAPRSLQ